MITFEIKSEDGRDGYAGSRPHAVYAHIGEDIYKLVPLHIADFKELADAHAFVKMKEEIRDGNPA